MRSRTTEQGFAVAGHRERATEKGHRRSPVESRTPHGYRAPQPQPQPQPRRVAAAGEPPLPPALHALDRGIGNHDVLLQLFARGRLALGRGHDAAAGAVVVVGGRLRDGGHPHRFAVAGFVAGPLLGGRGYDDAACDDLYHGYSVLTPDVQIPYRSPVGRRICFSPEKCYIGENQRITT